MTATGPSTALVRGIFDTFDMQILAGLDNVSQPLNFYITFTASLLPSSFWHAVDIYYCTVDIQLGLGGS